MSSSKIEFALGSLRFASEGEDKWVSTQLDKILSELPKLAQLQAQSPLGARQDLPNRPDSGADGSFKTTLASYLKAKGAESNQTMRFLATADWLRRRGATILTSSAVAKALGDNHQKRLGNPADCLNKNVSKGFCEKTKGGFFITPDGLKALGEA